MHVCMIAITSLPFSECSELKIKSMFNKVDRWEACKSLNLLINSKLFREKSIHISLFKKPEKQDNHFVM